MSGLEEKVMTHNPYQSPETQCQETEPRKPGTWPFICGLLFWLWPTTGAGLFVISECIVQQQPPWLVQIQNEWRFAGAWLTAQCLMFLSFIPHCYNVYKQIKEEQE
jgi:hypothetical protein